nr:helix-turn-helix transcriptional regulator [Pleionea sediminis]
MWLKESRNLRGLSMRELGERIDEPHSFVQKIESMERRLDAYELVQYCKALDIDPHDAISILEKSSPLH